MRIRTWCGSYAPLSAWRLVLSGWRLYLVEKSGIRAGLRRLRRARARLSV